MYQDCRPFLHFLYCELSVFIEWLLAEFKKNSSSHLKFLAPISSVCPHFVRKLGSAWGTLLAFSAGSVYLGIEHWLLAWLISRPPVCSFLAQVLCLSLSHGDSMATFWWCGCRYCWIFFRKISFFRKYPEMGWSRLMPAERANYAPLFPTCPVTSRRLLEIDYGGSIYSREISKQCKSGLFLSFFPEHRL